MRRSPPCTLLLCATAFLSFQFSMFPTDSYAHDQEGLKSIANSTGAGVGGGGPWASQNMTLLSHMPLNLIGGGQSNVLGNDIWGWTDPATGKEYAIFGLTNGTSFVDISNPLAPQYLGKLDTQTGNKAWRDMKVFNNQVYIVSDANGAHGMQIFDLTQLRTANPSNPQSFSNTGHYAGFERAHNIVINEATGFAYIVGSEVSNGGLHVLDLNGPAPVFAGQFTSDGYTHDAQVVNYHGPDTAYLNHEVAFNSNEDTLTIVDVTNKSNMTQISRTGYSGSEYSHQGWLSEDQRFFFMDDELDELRSSNVIPTRTRVWDVQDLDNPTYIGFHNGAALTIDHNLYVKGNYIFQANYSSGMRILKLRDAATLDMEEYGFFDTYNTDDNISFNGAWSCYPYFDSGSIIISDRQNGLFVVRMNHSVVAPLTANVVTGLFTSGTVDDLAVSDDFNFIAKSQRVGAPGNRTSSIVLRVAGVSPTNNPSDLSFTFEEKMPAIPGDIEQTVSLYNFDTDAWEVVDNRFLDEESEPRVESTASGDVSRFVQPGTGMIEARVNLQFVARRILRTRVRYTVEFDELTWTIGE